MNKNSDANINDILDRLRQNVESQDGGDSSDITESPHTVESPEKILDKLKEHMGNSESVSEDFRGKDYDISGFEIEASSDEEGCDSLVEPTEASGKADENFSDNDVSAECVAEDVESVSEEEGANSESFDMVEAHSFLDEEAELLPAAPMETANEDHVCPPSQKAPEAINDGQESVESVESYLEEQEIVSESNCSEEDDDVVSGESEELVRKQVELFVEKTIMPEEEFDYFAELERINAKETVINDTVEGRKEGKEEPVPIELENIVSSGEQPQKTGVLHVQEDTIHQPQTVLAKLEVAEDEQTVPQASDNQQDEINLDGAQPVCSPFFFQNGATEEPLCNELSSENVANRLDDTDINLLLSLGQKQAIEESVGFVRVREAKNNFYDPTEEDPIGDNIFAYDGQEFRCPEQAGEIKTRYRKAKKTVYKRLVGTLFLSLLLLLFEHFSFLKNRGVLVPNIFASVTGGHLICFLLSILCILCSAKSLLNGARGFFSMRPNQHTPIAILTIITLLYDVILILFFADLGLLTYNFSLSVFLILSIVGDAIRLSKESLTFDVISDEKEKFSLEKSDVSPELSREKEVLTKRDLLVERVSFVGKYFTRTARRPVAFTEYFIELLLALVVSIFLAIVCTFVTKSVALAVSTFMLSLSFCIPAQYLISDIYSWGKLSKKLFRHESAIIGENLDTEYVGANTIYLDDVEMFGHHGVSISGLRTYGNVEFYDVLYHARAVFSKIEGPLQYVFENASQEIKKSEDVKLVGLYKDGIEAHVDSRNRVLIGNFGFMRSNGFSPKQNEEDDKKVEDGELCVLYMCINEEFCAKFYMKYAITQRFEKFVAEMNENGTQVGIRTIDPNVTELMLSVLRKGTKPDISVIRPGVNDLVPLGRRSDSSIITAKSPHMISRILAQCAQLKKIYRTEMLMRLLSMTMGFVIVLACIFGKVVAGIPSLVVSSYQILWLIPSIFYVNIKMK